MDDPIDDQEELTRSDLRLIRGAIRQDWPIPPAVQAKILKRLVEYLDLDQEEGATAPDRTVLMAARTVAAFGALALKQQALDLQREKLDGKHKDQLTLADAVADAERLATERLNERASEGCPRDPVRLPDL